ncbi:MAG: cation diffusion facilitator family transporter [Actinobacteria bacterium]|nr:cation diffusion facilitator family transporter [Actinomycetota bacterium]
MSTTRRLKLGIALGLILVAAEAGVGITTRSLALVSDAVHNAADIMAVGLSLFAVYMMARAPTERRTFGYGRVGILTALANSVALVAIAGILAYEAVMRIIHVRPVSGTAIFTVGIVAFAINSVVALTLFSHRHDLNIKSAFLHMVADAGVSIGVLVAGAIIAITTWYYADPVIALVIRVFIVSAAWGIVRDATDVLLESVPRQMDMAQVQKAIESIPGVQAVHHLHVWELGSGVYALSGHVEAADRALSECSAIMENINETLKEYFNIIHPTIQMECAAQCPAPGEGPIEG